MLKFAFAESDCWKLLQCSEMMWCPVLKGQTEQYLRGYHSGLLLPWGQRLSFPLYTFPAFEWLPEVQRGICGQESDQKLPNKSCGQVSVGKADGSLILTGSPIVLWRERVLC